MAPSTWRAACSARAVIASVEWSASTVWSRAAPRSVIAWKICPMPADCWLTAAEICRAEVVAVALGQRHPLVGAVPPGAAELHRLLDPALHVAEHVLDLEGGGGGLPLCSAAAPGDPPPAHAR